MKRRTFLKGLLAAAGLAVLPKTQEPKLELHPAQRIIKGHYEDKYLSYNGTPWYANQYMPRGAVYCVQVDSTPGRESITFDRPLDGEVTYRSRS
jgi:hypothetical protein